MGSTTHSEQKPLSRDLKCILKKCQINKKCIKDQLKQQELTLIECGLVMLGLSTKNNYKNSESKLPRKNKIQLKFL